MPNGSVPTCCKFVVGKHTEISNRYTWLLLLSLFMCSKAITARNSQSKVHLLWLVEHAYMCPCNTMMSAECLVRSETDASTFSVITPPLYSTCAGTGGGHSDSRMASPSSQSYVPTPSRSTQARRMDVGGLGTHARATTVSDGTMRSMVRQLNAFSRRDLLLGRFELLGPHHRRQGGVHPVRRARWATSTSVIPEYVLWYDLPGTGLRSPCRFSQSRTCPKPMHIHSRSSFPCMHTLRCLH